MKTRTKKILLIVLIPLCGFVGMCVFGFYYQIQYVHRHCMPQIGSAFQLYADDHFGQLPFSTNGFGNALLLLVRSDSTNDYLGGLVATLCAPDDAGHIFEEALKNNSIIPEEKCSRIYIQGLSESNNPEICILFDRNSCKGGDHGRSPWGHLLREACLLDGSMQIIRDEDWPEFSRKQVELLVAAGFARTNALHFYPAAR